MQKNQRSPFGGHRLFLVSQVHNRRLSAPALLGLFWALLATGPFLSHGVGGSAATFILFFASTGLALFSLSSVHAMRSPFLPFTLSLLIGFLLAPSLIVIVLQAGQAFAFNTTRVSPSDPLILISALLMAPFFEEVIYREHLLAWLQRRTAASLAILLSSLAFALPHPGQWSMLSSFVAGLFLGWARFTGGHLLHCIGIHAGLNLAGEVFAAGHWAVLPPPLLGLCIALPALLLLTKDTKAHCGVNP